MPKFMTRALGAAMLSWCVMTTGASGQIFGLLQEEADCEGDAFRFCGQYIPNHAQIHACLYAYRNEISPACRAIVAPPKHRR